MKQDETKTATLLRTPYKPNIFIFCGNCSKGRDIIRTLMVYGPENI